MEDITKIVLVEIKGKTDNLKNEVVSLNKSLDTLKANQKALEAQGKKNTREYIDNQTQIRAVSTAIRENNREIDNTVKAMKMASGSLAQNRALVASLTPEYNKLAAENGKMSKGAVDMAAKIKALTDKIKEQEEATGNHKSSVGDYGKAFDKAGESMSSFGGVLGDAVKGLNMMRSGLNATKEGSKSLDMALKATGFGLFITIIASVISYLKKLDPVMDFIERAFSGFGAVVTTVGRVITDFITGIKSAGDLFSKLGNIMAHPIDSFKKLGKEIGNAAKEAYNLKGAMQDLADQKDITDMAVKQMQAEANVLKIQARNRSLSAKDRQDLLKKAGDLELEAGKRLDNIAKQTINLAVIQAGELKKLKQNDIEELKKGNIARANQLLNEGKITKEAYEALKEAYNLQIEQKSRLTERLEGLQVRQDMLADKAEQDAEKRREREQKALDALNTINEKNYQLKLSLLQDNLEKEADLIANAEKRSQAKELARHKNALAEYKSKLGDNAEINALINEAIEIENRTHEKNLTEIRLKGEQDRKLVEQTKNAERLKRSHDVNEEIKRQDEELSDWRKSQAEKEAAEQSELRKGMASNVIAGAKSINEAIAQSNADRVKREADREIESSKQLADTQIKILQNRLDKGLITEQEFEQKKSVLDAQAQQRQNEIRRKAFEDDKKLKIKMTIMNGALAIINAFATLPYPANAVAAVGVGIETGIQVGIIRNQKFARGGVYKSDGRGGVLPGYSQHDNVNAQLREGEVQIVPEAGRNPWARNLLSSINVMFGGKDFSSPNTTKAFAAGGIYNDGGYSGRYYSQQSSGADNMTANIVQGIMSNLPPLIVDVKDIHSELGVLVQTKNRADL